MTLFQAIILGILQGITEFLPISSSGHLIIAPYIFNWDTQPVEFDLFLHFGTLLALLVYYRKMLWNILKNICIFKSSGVNKYQDLALKIVIATLPAILVGLLFRDFIEEVSDNILIIIFNLIFLGIIFIIADRIYMQNKGKIDGLNQKKSLIIGLFQPIAFLRGTSRSGISILGGLTQGLSYKEATEFSFLLGILTISGAMGLLLKDYSKIINSDIPVLYFLIGTTAAFFTGLLCIKFMITWVDKIGLRYFGVYRIVLGIILLVLFLYK